MNTDNNLEKIKTLLSKYLVYVFLILIIIILILVFLPRKDNHKNVDSNLTLMLKGNYNLSIVKGETYIESGYTAYDSKEGDLTSKVVVDGSVIEKSVEVKNIDKKKPIGSCKNVINDKKTVISVTASD